MADTITAKILRYDPSVDEAPHFETYEVEWIEDESGIMSALQVLASINENQEQIGYDWCCHSSLCGRCSMLIDGVPRLACMTALEPGEHTFEPLPGFPVLKDLVVDRQRAYDRMVGVDVSIKTKEPITTLKNIDHDLYWNTLERINMCRECMCCYAACPKLQKEGIWSEFAGPGALIAIAQRYLDGIDESDRLGQAVGEGLFRCDLCGECTMVCSAGIDIAGILGAMQEDAKSAGLAPEQTEEHFF